MLTVDSSTELFTLFRLSSTNDDDKKENSERSIHLGENIGCRWIQCYSRQLTTTTSSSSDETSSSC